MFEIISAGGWLMLPLVLSSVAVLAVSLERAWTFSSKQIAPKTLSSDIWSVYSKQRKLTTAQLKSLRTHSQLGSILAAGIANVEQGRDAVREAMESAAYSVIHTLEKYLVILSIIATVAPLIGLLGTVIGMIDVFTAIVNAGQADPSALAGGISKALITTAAGLTVAIPATIVDRYFSRRIETISVQLERESSRFVDAMFALAPKVNNVSETVDSV